MPDVARPLPLTAVRLTGGPLKRAQELDAKYLLELEPDRMLAFYRQRAGLVPKAQPYGGWDGDGRNLTGHIAGHYLSGGEPDVGGDRRRPIQGARGLHRQRAEGGPGQARRRLSRARSPADGRRSPSCPKGTSGRRRSI